MPKVESYKFSPALHMSVMDVFNHIEYIDHPFTNQTSLNSLGFVPMCAYATQESLWSLSLKG